MIIYLFISFVSIRVLFVMGVVSSDEYRIDIHRLRQDRFFFLFRIMKGGTLEIKFFWEFEKI